MTVTQSPRLEGEMQTQVDETASSLQEMVVDKHKTRVQLHVAN